MSETELQSDESSPKLLRRTVIKMTAAGVAFSAAGGNLAGSAAAQGDAEAEIVLPAQQTSGFEIEIETATIPDGGYISLVDPVNPHEKIWPEIGETMPTEQEVIENQTVATTEYLESGTHENIVLELDRPLDFGHNVEDDRDTRDLQQKLYQVWMHRDSSGEQTFENVSPGEEDNRYGYEQEGQHRAEVDEIVIGEAYLEFAPFNPSTLQSQLEQSQTRLSELESQISELESANEDYEGRISELEEERDTLNQEVSDLEDRIAELEDSNENGNSENGDNGGSSDDGGAGFGIVTALVGGAAGAAAAMKRLGGSGEEDEE